MNRNEWTHCIFLERASFSFIRFFDSNQCLNALVIRFPSFFSTDVLENLSPIILKITHLLKDYV